jgi:hypothetical protein
MQGHFRQGSKEHGPMKSNITIGYDSKIGPTVFRWWSKTKTNQIMLSLHGIILKRNAISPQKKSLMESSGFGEPTL